MASKAPLKIDPPLLNSACLWATTLEDIKALYECPYTGAVTTRTSLLEGFSHDDAVHQFVFFEAGKSAASAGVNKYGNEDGGKSSLNTMGYSPITLSEYLGYINEIVGQRHLGTDTVYKKPFILSVTGTSDEVAMAYALIANAAEMDEDLRLMMEVNLSCPNLDGKPPPSYSEDGLREFLEAVGDAKRTYRGRMGEGSVPRVGIKLPPYTWVGQFEMVVSALRGVLDEGESESMIDFVVCCNSLGSSLVMADDRKTVLSSESGTGVGGLGGAALHPLALGNVATMRKLLDKYEETKGVVVIGVGGVEDRDGFERMIEVGAGAVACATALGREGVGVFEKIAKGMGNGKV
jgi:dihydroorotate dehydrogenase (fumarate)